MSVHIFAFCLSFLVACGVIMAIRESLNRDTGMIESYTEQTTIDRTIASCLPNPSWTILNLNAGRLAMCIYTPYKDAWKRLSDSTVTIRDPSAKRDMSFHVYSKSPVTEKAWSITPESGEFVINGVNLDGTTITGPQMSAVKLDASTHIGDLSIVWNMSYHASELPVDEELILFRLPMTGTAGTSYFKVVLVHSGGNLFINVDDDEQHTWKIPANSAGSTFCIRRKLAPDSNASTLSLAIEAVDKMTHIDGTDSDTVSSPSNAGRLYPSTETIRANPDSSSFGDVKLTWLGISHKYIMTDALGQLCQAIGYEISGRAETCRMISKDYETSLSALKKQHNDQLAATPECPVPGNNGASAKPSWYIDLMDVLGSATSLSEVPDSICELKVIPSGQEAEYVNEITRRPGYQHLTIPEI